MTLEGRRCLQMVAMSCSKVLPVPWPGRQSIETLPEARKTRSDSDWTSLAELWLGFSHPSTSRFFAGNSPSSRPVTSGFSDVFKWTSLAELRWT